MSRHHNNFLVPCVDGCYSSHEHCCSSGLQVEKSFDHLLAPIGAITTTEERPSNKVELST